jgi:hypothetical protein
MSQRLGAFCDFATSDGPCQAPAVGTCRLCKRDFCVDHCTGERAFKVTIAAMARTPGSSALHESVTAIATLPLCKECLEAFVRLGSTKRDDCASAALEAAAAVLSATLSELALTAKEPSTL